MPMELIVKCDLCQVVKKESNRWLAGSFDYESEMGRIVVIRVRELPQELESFRHLRTWCGVPCFVKAVEREMVTDVEAGIVQTNPTSPR